MKTAVSGDDFDPRKIAMLLGLAGAGVVGWKLVKGRKVKSTELLSALLGLWGFFNK
ncbi:MAG: hypothetical protein M0Z46_05340 [Actinomycetota bacterium]|jgi:hypothetical protein|nr:hypothetical protein [Actinomycetota bacterium]MDA8356096.1 hypothetical protein [Actinomycetota bacterium]